VCFLGVEICFVKEHAGPLLVWCSFAAVEEKFEKLELNFMRRMIRMVFRSGAVWSRKYPRYASSIFRIEAFWSLFFDCLYIMSTTV
jgi:hypothetical protein